MEPRHAPIVNELHILREASFTHVDFVVHHGREVVREGNHVGGHLHEVVHVLYKKTKELECIILILPVEYVDYLFIL